MTTKSLDKKTETALETLIAKGQVTGTLPFEELQGALPSEKLGDIEVLLDERPDVWSVGDYDPDEERLLWRGDADASPDQFILVRNFDEHLRRVAPPSE